MLGAFKWVLAAMGLRLSARCWRGPWVTGAAVREFSATTRSDLCLECCAEWRAQIGLLPFTYELFENPAITFIALRNTGIDCSMTEQAPRKPKRKQLQEAYREQPRWKRFLLMGAAVFLVIGVALKGIEFASGSDNSSGSISSSGGSGSGNPAGAQGFLPTGGGTTDTGAGDDGEERPWSSFFFFGGFSFFVGFCVGYALRAFFKFSAITIGVIMLAMFGLSYLGFVDVNWSEMKEMFDNLIGRVREESEHFKSFITGSLPSAAAGSTGLFAGFRRK